MSSRNATYSTSNSLVSKTSNTLSDCLSHFENYLHATPIQGTRIYYGVNKYILDNYETPPQYNSPIYIQATNSYILRIITVALKFPEIELKTKGKEQFDVNGHSFQEYPLKRFAKIRAKVKSNSNAFLKSELNVHNIRFIDIEKLVDENRLVSGLYRVDKEFYLLEFVNSVTQSKIWTSVKNQNLIFDYISVISEFERGRR